MLTASAAELVLGLAKILMLGFFFIAVGCFVMGVSYKLVEHLIAGLKTLDRRRRRSTCLAPRP